MVNLSSTAARFEIPFTVVEGGSGVFKGVLAEAEQNSQPSYVFSPPRLVLRVRTSGVLKPGVAIQSPEGIVYLVGYNGPSETHMGHLWDSFRLFKATEKVLWQRRIKIVDPVTGLDRDAGLQTIGNVWAAIEQIDREVLDRKVHASVEQARYVCSANILADDVLNDRQVTRADKQLGLTMGTLS